MIRCTPFIYVSDDYDNVKTREHLKLIKLTVQRVYCDKLTSRYKYINYMDI